ncbi:MAG: S-layer homology domain-containing protein [Clostridia bacterium]|nr:S-layer homology domain-containing protein [Clostridia bacterium]
MKKMLACLLVVVMLVSAMPAVFGTEDEGLSNAILTAKSRIAISEDYTEFDSNLYTDDSGSSVYSLYWSKENDLKYESISVEINNRGDILRYRNSAAGDDTGEIRFAVYNGEEMKNLAIDWMAKVNPEWLSQLPVEKISAPDYGNPRYHTDNVYFIRQVNGLDYCGDYVRVSVNNLTGAIVSMSAEWTYETPAYTPEEAMGAAEAGAAFLEQSPMELAYHSKGEQEAVLAYTPKDAYLQLNGRSGEEFEEFHPYRDYGMSGGGSNSAMTESVADTAADEKFTESELKNLQEVEDLLSENILRATAESLENTGLRDANFMNISYRNYKEEIDGEEVTRYNATLSYITPGEEETHYSVTLDAKTGELLSYSSYPATWDDTEATITQENARAKADAFLMAYAADAFADAKIKETETDGKSDYFYSYIRYANDIPFYENQLTINVDKKTGRIQRFSKSWDDDIIFDTPAGILTAEEAGNQLLAQTGMVLTYAKAQDGDSTIPKIELMYALNYDLPYYVDAKTGSLLNYNMEAYTPDSKEIPLPEDIGGHYAETQILTLIESGMLEGTDTFRPDDFMTQKEMLAFVCGLNMGYIPYNMEYTSLTKNAARYGISGLSNDPEAPITREQAVEFIICALGYKEVAELRGIYMTKFADHLSIMPHKLGYLALAKGLQIIQGDEAGRFHPQDYLTRSDAAIMIYNYLSR